MKVVSAIILVILILLAIASGVTKVLLMEQDVEFFGKFGFSSLILMSFGFAQLLGGFLLIFAKTRFAGAAIVTITFLVSLTLLLVDGNIPVSIITGCAILLLAVIMKQSLPRTPK